MALRNCEAFDYQQFNVLAQTLNCAGSASTFDSILRQ